MMRSPDLDDTIVSELSDGKPLRQIAREYGFSKSAFYDWCKADEELAGRIARARQEGFDAIAESILEIVDDKAEDPASRRVRADMRLKLLAKWDYKRYGDKIGLGDLEGGPLSVTVMQFSATSPDT